jgi:hypothetical protein
LKAEFRPTYRIDTQVVATEGLKNRARGAFEIFDDVPSAPKRKMWKEEAGAENLKAVHQARLAANSS